jgi:hypothetical protein
MYPSSNIVTTVHVCLCPLALAFVTCSCLRNYVPITPFVYGTPLGCLSSLMRGCEFRCPPNLRGKTKMVCTTRVPCSCVVPVAAMCGAQCPFSVAPLPRKSSAPAPSVRKQSVRRSSVVQVTQQAAAALMSIDYNLFESAFLVSSVRMTPPHVSKTTQVVHSAAKASTVPPQPLA